MESGFCNPKNFCLWNTESGKIFPMESEILDQESWGLESGIQLKDFGIKVPLKKTWWNTESGKIFPMESAILDQES